MKLPLSFYKGSNVVEIARNLIGKTIFTNIDEEISSGIITETEAYAGITDKASHAFGGKRTKRTETMFLDGGRTYVYLCYGIHNLFNIVTGPAETPHAVLIRGITTQSGLEIIKTRTGKSTLTGISNGPGKLTKALGINSIHNNISIIENTIWVEDIKIKKFEIEVSKRIGIDYAKEDALLPYRFNLKM